MQALAPFILGALLSCAWCSADAEEIIKVRWDGSVLGRFASLREGTASVEAQTPLVFSFGLPDVPATRIWQENEVVYGLWVTNGVCYTQTVCIGLASRTDHSQAAATSEDSLVLLVNVEGENTNSYYADAAAEFALEIEGKRQPVALEDGVIVWHGTSGKQTVLAGLDIPQPGVKVTSGLVLQFQGHMPPSIKGSMTVKIPLGTPPKINEADPLRELEFERALRTARGPGGVKDAGQFRLVVEGKS
jgi:hypothetical protein